MSSLQKLTHSIKSVILDAVPDGRQEIFIFQNSLIPEHQLVEKNKNTAKNFEPENFRDGIDSVSFRSELKR